MIYYYGIEKVIHDIASYLFLISIIFLIFFVKNNFFSFKIKNKKKIFLITIFFSITPFFFNSFLFDPSKMWDQFTYLKILNNPSEISLDHLKIFVPVYIYKLFFIFPTSSINSIAFINKFILLSSLIFLLEKKKINFYSFLFIVLVPSVILYSSVSLKEILITTISLWTIYFIFEKKIYSFFSSLFILFIIRPEYAIIFGSFLIVTENNFNLKKYAKFIYIIIFLILLFLVSKYFGFILNKISELKMIYIQETHTWQSPIYATDRYILFNFYDLIRSLFTEIPIKFFALKNINFSFVIFFFIENLLIIFFVYRCFFNQSITKNKKIIYTIYIVSAFIFIYFFVDNQFTAHRYFFSFFSSYLIFSAYIRKNAE